MPITISGDTVTIGKLVFTRSVSGVVTDVHFDGNILELTKELTALNMTPEDVYNGKVCMSNDVLIQNFGMICKQTATSNGITTQMLSKTLPSRKQEMHR